MDALTQQLMQALSSGGISEISRRIGADEQTTGLALSAAVPVLVSALANNASKPRGAKSLQRALIEDHDGSALDDLSSYLANPDTEDGAAILKHVLGKQQASVKKGLAQGAGLKSAQAGQLLQIVAPLLMGALGKQQQQQGFDASGLASFLGGQQQEVVQETQAPAGADMMGLLNTLLDKNRNGSALDEVLGMVGKLLSGR